MPFGGWENERENCPKGWLSIVDKLHADIEAIAPGHYVAQIKEKFGGLRYYVTWPEGTTPEVQAEGWALMDAAERESFTVCMVCGEPGEVRGSGWIVTMCDTHYKESEARRG